MLKNKKIMLLMFILFIGALIFIAPTEVKATSLSEEVPEGKIWIITNIEHLTNEEASYLTYNGNADRTFLRLSSDYSIDIPLSGDFSTALSGYDLSQYSSTLAFIEEFDFTDYYSEGHSLGIHSDEHITSGYLSYNNPNNSNITPILSSAHNGSRW